MSEKDYMEDCFSFAKAEISTHPDLGFITLRIVRFESDPSKGLVPSVLHKLSPENVEDLIGHLQASLAQYRNPKERDSLKSSKH